MNYSLRRGITGRKRGNELAANPAVAIKLRFTADLSWADSKREEQTFVGGSWGPFVIRVVRNLWALRVGRGGCYHSREVQLSWSRPDTRRAPIAFVYCPISGRYGA